MPNLGAGVDQHVNLAATPTWVFTPTPNAPATIRLFNEGRNTVFVGQANVSPSNGFPLPPNGKIDVANVTQTVYGCSICQGAAAGATTLTAAPTTAGTTSFTVSSAAGFANGATLLVGAGSSADVVAVTGLAGAVVTSGTPLLYDHALSSPVTVATLSIGQLRVTAGVV